MRLNGKLAALAFLAGFVLLSVESDAQFIQPTNNGGIAGSVVVGTTTISGGTNARVLYDNTGVLGEYTATQLTAQINAATTALSGALPAWPNNTTTFFRGDGTYATLNCAALTNGATGCSTAIGTSGATIPLLNAANSWAATQTLGVAPVFTDQSGSRTALGLGTSATVNTGTSGATIPLLNAPNAWSASQTLGSSSLLFSGAISSAAWTTAGLRIQLAAASFTDTSSSGTVAAAYSDLYGATTILASSATTYTQYYGAFFKAPVASTNVTMTNKSALGADTISVGGAAQSTDALAVTGTIKGSSSITGGGNFITSSSGCLVFAVNAMCRNSSTGEISITTNASVISLAPASGSSVFVGNGSGTTNPTARTLAFENAGTINFSGAQSTVIASLSMGSGTSGDLVFQTGIKSGSSGVQATPTTALTIKGETQLVTLPAITSDATHTDSAICQDTTTHALYSGSGTLGVCLGTSSGRYKTAVADIKYGIADLVKLEPRNFRYLKGWGDNGVKEQNGFIAEEMVSVLPSLVSMDVQNRPNSVDLVGLIPILVKALQQQQVQINSLQAVVDSLPPGLKKVSMQ